MELSPLEITQREFSRTFRGLDPEEVQAFLEQVAGEMTRLVQENAERSGQVQRLEAQLRGHAEREDVLRATLLSAQKMADEMKTQAQREAELLLKEAELKAERLLEQAQRKLGQILAETAEAKRQHDLFVAKLRHLLQTHLELIETAARPTEPPERSA